jgi:hypothetical protein
VPTPFTHLRFALDLLADGLPPEVEALLRAEQPAFLLGNIAPDVQAVSGQPREATHFFAIPRRDAVPAHRRLFEQHPTLARPRRMPASQAAAVSGYLAHLLLDEIWIQDIFEPVFGTHQPWGTLPERLYLHNALRSYLDGRDRRYLPHGTAASLQAARPRHWLPFVGDDHLLQWRDLVAEQLTPGQPNRTVEVFAERMGADPQALAALLASPEEMQRRIWTRLPSGKLDACYAEGQAQAARLLAAYWS